MRVTPYSRNCPTRMLRDVALLSTISAWVGGAGLGPLSVAMGVGAVPACSKYEDTRCKAIQPPARVAQTPCPGSLRHNSGMQHDDILRVATYNLRVPCDPAPNDWPSRAPRVARTLSRCQFDIFGAQEAVDAQIEGRQIPLAHAAQARGERVGEGRERIGRPVLQIAFLRERKSHN